MTTWPASVRKRSLDKLSREEAIRFLLHRTEEDRTKANNLAQLFQTTNRLGEAEPLMRRALAIDEAAFGNDHPGVATDLNNLARLLQATNRLEEAEPLIRRAVAIWERSLGPDHPMTQLGRKNLEILLSEMVLGAEDSE